VGHWVEEAIMHRPTFLCLLPLAVCGFIQAQDAPSVDDLVAKSVAARGGDAKVKAIQSIKVTGTMTAPTGMQLPLTILVKRPGLIRTEMSLQGNSLVQAYDGVTAWVINPMTGSSDPRPSSESDSKNIRNGAESFLDGPLVDYKAKGSKVEYLGKEDVNGSPAYKLKITTKSGMEMTVYLDAKSYLEVRTTAKVTQMGQEMEVDNYPGDYKPEAGVLMAHTMESKMNGATMMKMSLDKIEINGPVDDAAFKMPAKPETKKQ